MSRPEDQQSSALLKRQGDQAFARGDYAGAEKLYSEAIRHNSRSPVLFSNRAACYQRLQMYSRALRDADVVTRLIPEWPKGYFRKGVAYEAMLQFGEALRVFEQGMALCSIGPTSEDTADKDFGEELRQLSEACEGLKAINRELKQSSIDEASLKAELLWKDKQCPVDKQKAVCDWVMRQGGRIPKLWIQLRGEELYRVVSRAHIDVGEILAVLPSACMLTVNSDRKVRAAQTHLAIFLLEQRALDDKSAWYPYISSLPKKCLMSPITFRGEFLEILCGGGGMGKQMVEDRLYELKQEYAALCDDDSQFAVDHALGDFLWARAIVGARTMGTRSQSQACLPLIDYFEIAATSQANCMVYTAENGNIHLRALSSVAPGDPLRVSIGRKCNSRLLLNYGTTLRVNPDNEAILRVRFEGDKSKLWPTKLVHMGVLQEGERLVEVTVGPLGQKVTDNAVSQLFQCPASYSHRKTKELFSWCRYCALSSDEYQEIIWEYKRHHKQCGTLTEESVMQIPLLDVVSLKNECLVLRAVLDGALAALRRFDCSVSADDQLLALLAEADKAQRDIRHFGFRITQLGPANNISKKEKKKQTDREEFTKRVKHSKALLEKCNEQLCSKLFSSFRELTVAERQIIRNCIQFRRGEKLVLLWFVHLTTEALRLFALPQNKLSVAIRKSFKRQNAFDHYVINAIYPLMNA